MGIFNLRFLWRFSGFASSHRAHAFVGDPARAMSLSRCAANFSALQSIARGLVDSALGEDDVFVACPLRKAASELVIRKPTDAAKAASVVCAASGFPAAGFF